MYIQREKEGTQLSSGICNNTSDYAMSEKMTEVNNRQHNASPF